MIKKQIVAIYDTKAEHYSQFPFNGNTNDETAMRDFADALKNPDSMMANNPYDYHLVHIGEWNMVTGIITPNEKPRVICTAVDILGTKENSDG